MIKQQSQRASVDAAGVGVGVGGGHAHGSHTDAGRTLTWVWHR